MARTVAQMTKAELQALIETVVESAVEQKLHELLGDPDADRALRKSVHDRLRRQQQAVAAGERGKLLARVRKQLSLE